MARKFRRNSTRSGTPSAAHASATHDAGRATSPAFQDLLRLLGSPHPEPMAPEPVATFTQWGWLLTVRQGALCVRPVGLTEAGVPDLLATKWSLRQGRWSPAPAAGWTESERMALWAVWRGAALDHGWLPLRSEESLDALRSDAAQHPLFFLRRGSLGPATVFPLAFTADKAADLQWHETSEGGLRLRPMGEAPWFFLGETGWTLTLPALTAEETEQPNPTAPEGACEGGHGSEATPALVPVRHESVGLSRVAASANILTWAHRHGRLTAADVAMWRLRHAHDPRLSALPLPAHLRPVTVEEHPRLIGRVVPMGDERTLYLGMQMEVAYGDHRLPLAGPDLATLTQSDGAAVQIHRKRGVERRVMNEMAKSGLRLWPHPFSKRDAFPVGWPLEWLKEQDAIWAAGEPPPNTVNGWFSLAHQMETMGVSVEWDARLPFGRAQSQQRWTAHVAPEASSQGKWLEAGVGVDIDGVQVDLTGALIALLKDAEFPIEAAADESPYAVWTLRIPTQANRAAYLDVPLTRLRALLAPLRSAERVDPKTNKVRIPTMALGELQSWPTQVDLSADLQTLWQRIQRSKTDLPQPPQDLQATLRPYQLEGLAWLNFLSDMQWGGVLADDMGLGKTIQMLAHLLRERAEGNLKQPALVVVPASLLSNWGGEAARFAPSLRTVILYGPQRTAAWERLVAGDVDVAITTYTLMSRDIERLAEQPFSLVAFDEAQMYLKNARTEASKSARRLQTARRIPLTGTPVENHLGELWSIMDLAMPGLLGTREAFRTRFQNPIERHNDPLALAALRARMAPFLLRRHKSEVARDLPPKTEIVTRLNLPESQRALYETVRAQQQARVHQAVAEQGMGGSHLVVLDALLKLRQVCCDPDLLGEAGKDVESVKREHLINHLESLLDEGRQVLVISQFTQVLARIEADLKARKISYEVLTGDTPPLQRGERVERFQSGQAKVFLLSLKAGGVGLNLTAADTVIHYDPWWNPAAEHQATDRAHRIGQDKPVFVFRLICEGTVEERILELQTRKSQLADAVLDGLGGGLTGLDLSDLDALFAPVA